MRQVDRAIADFDAALKIDPEKEEALYGRGLAKAKNGNQVAGDADMAAATAIRADIAKDFANYGI